ncbi:MAG: hypothetical protein MJ238_06505 [Bacilli bacterium]|nr:hypothetical protein [Bacilli bacterium]
MSNKKKIKAKKANTKKTSAWGKIWAGAKYFLKSLFSNDQCVDARTKPWYYAVIIAVLAVIVAVIPLMSNTFSIKGGDFLNGTTYDLTSQIVDFTADMKSKGVEIKIENGTANDPAGTWLSNYGDCYKHVVKKNISYVKVDEAGENPEVVVEEVSYVDFAVYYLPDTADISKSVETILKGKNPVIGEEKVADHWTINSMFIGKDCFYMYKKYIPTGSEKEGSIPAFSSMRGYKFDCKGINGEASYLLSSLYGADNEETLNNWSSYLNLAYSSTRIKTGWATTGLGLGIYAALTIILGGVVWIMTRGKNNPFRIYKFWECEKIAYWASFAPALLALILGFFLKNYALLLFILFFGLRIMWMSMKSLKPYQA